MPLMSNGGIFSHPAIRIGSMNHTTFNDIREQLVADQIDKRWTTGHS